MPPKDGTQHKLDRVRPPRVQITYDVEIGGAQELKELPFVMGVMGDFSGDSAKDLPRFKERKFVEITPDNFDQVLKTMRPTVSFTVDNKLGDPTKKIPVNLTFESLEDFEPEEVVRKVEPLNKLLELRERLTALRGNLQGNEQLEELLREAVTNSEQRTRLAAELNIKEPGKEQDNG